MAPGVPTKVIAAGCGLTAFAVGILSGLFAGNPADTILLRAIVALIGGQVVGFVVGMIGERVISEAILSYEKANPIGGPRTRPGDAAAATAPSGGKLSP